MVDSSSSIRVVPDSNVIVAAQRSPHPNSPNREFLSRWQQEEFAILFSSDTLREYARKLIELTEDREAVVEFIALLVALGESVDITYFHLPIYPVDADDIAFLLCAWNGLATHLVSYDSHLLDLATEYESHFRICRILNFLAELRRPD